MSGPEPSDKSPQRLPPELRRIVLIVVGTLALVELLALAGFATGVFSR